MAKEWGSVAAAVVVVVAVRWCGVVWRQASAVVCLVVWTVTTSHKVCLCHRHSPANINPINNVLNTEKPPLRNKYKIVASSGQPSITHRSYTGLNLTVQSRSATNKNCELSELWFVSPRLPPSQTLDLLFLSVWLSAGCQHQSDAAKQMKANLSARCIPHTTGGLAGLSWVLSLWENSDQIYWKWAVTRCWRYYW